MSASGGPRVLSLVWNLIRGGTEGQCARVALGLAARGLSHRVWVSRREGFFLNAVERACGPVETLDIHRMVSLKTSREIARLAAWLRDQRIDLLHAWDADACIFGAAAARKAGIPYLTSRRDLGTIYAPRKLARMKKADRAAAGVIVNAEAVRDYALEDGLDASHVHLVPNILDLEEFDRLRTEPLPGDPFPAAARLVVCVARLDPEKDVATLIKAFAGMPVKDDVFLVIAGDGPERPALEELARARDLLPRVRFLGDVAYVPQLLERAEIGVLVPVENEGLSNTILEYLAAGLPVVATNCGGNRELVRDRETGTMVPTRRPQQLARALRGMLSHPDDGRAMGRRGRALVEKRHAPEVVLDRFEQLYREVVRS